MNRTKALFKIGGKILGDFENLKSTMSQLNSLFEENLIQKIIIIPGGGIFANFIRKVYTELKFTEEIAHFMGIISMNYNGLELSKLYPNLQVIVNFSKLKEMGDSISLFLPYDYLKENDILPHSWEVTSDSITLFLAKQLGLNECFLIKDVDGILDNNYKVIKQISASEFKEMKDLGKLYKENSNNEELKKSSTPIDPYVLTLVENYKISCIILNGSKNAIRISNYFKSSNNEEKVYTEIK
ncbi:MAG: hypothetical protein ACFFC3_15105 [Candidatus Odinarchaeota archaeon]